MALPKTPYLGYESVVQVGSFDEKTRAQKSRATVPLKGHEIFTVIFSLEWIYLGLTGNSFWFLNFKDVCLILDSNFK
jgi:hypothetical protein